MTNPHDRVESAAGIATGSGHLVCMRDVVDAMEEHGDLRDGDCWGPWVWNEDRMALEYTGGHYAHHPYGVDVEAILDADDPDAEAWDWVRHVAGKRWDPPAIRCLVLGLREVLRQQRRSS